MRLPPHARRARRPRAPAPGIRARVPVVLDLSVWVCCLIRLIGRFRVLGVAWLMIGEANTKIIK